MILKSTDDIWVIASVVFNYTQDDTNKNYEYAPIY